ncbi:hypothetical protein LCGC14_0971950, partial [marine sediment metagenome]
EEDTKITYAEARKRIALWLPYTEGKSFEVRDVTSEFNVGSAEGKHNVRQALSNLKREGVLSGDRGRYRYINRELEPLNWVEADTNEILDIKWPYGWGDSTSFGFDDNLTLFPNSIVVVSGPTNIGKSGLALNVVALNCDSWECRYLTNEMGAEELKDRLSNFEEHYALTDEFGSSKFEAAVRYDNYEDVILPKGLTVIDYLDPGENAYMVGQQVDAIRRRLNGGVVFIVMQKKMGSEYAIGGQYSEHRARIVLHIDRDKNGQDFLLVKKAKKCRKENLNGKKFTFSLRNNGTQFYNIRPYVEGENG